MRANWRRSVSVIVSFGLIVSSMAYTGKFSADSTVRAVETVSDGDVNTGAEITDTATGYKYKLCKDESEITTAEITGYTGEERDLVIPAKIGAASEYKVTAVGEEAFRESEITSVTISEGIEVIGYESFAGCQSLQSVKIPSTIVNWEENVNDKYLNGAFMDCTALTTLDLADGLTALGFAAFRNCTALTSVEIPSTIMYFADFVFRGCSKLENVELAEGITQMGYQAFRECTSLKQVKVPSTINLWRTARNGGHAQVHDCAPFYGCTSLEKVTFAEGLTTLCGFQGVRGCPLVKSLDIPASVTNIDYAFTDCEYLEKVTLHDGLESVGTNAFEGCGALKEMVIPATVTTLGYRAFYRCKSMERLVLSSKLVNIDNSITSDCDSLKEIYLLALSMPYKDNAFNMAADGKYYCLPESETYNTYFGKNPDATEEIPIFSDIEAEGYSGVYDGENHEVLAETTGIAEGDTVKYCISGTDEFQTDIPKIKEPGEYIVDILVIRTAQDGTTQVGMAGAEAEIQKKESSIRLKNTEVTGSEYTMEPESYVGDAAAEITYSYYKDETLVISCEKPTEPGVYYVMATVAESAYYKACESNVVTLTITEKPDTENSPSPTPSGSAKATFTPAPAASKTPAPKPTAKIGKKSNTNIKKVSINKVKSPSKKKIDVRWKKISGVTGYQVIVGLNKKFKKGKKIVTVKGASKTKAIVKNVKRKKWYYVKVRAYKNVSGTKKYGKWSSVRRVKVK